MFVMEKNRLVDAAAPVAVVEVKVVAMRLVRSGVSGGAFDPIDDATGFIAAGPATVITAAGRGG